MDTRPANQHVNPPFWFNVITPGIRREKLPSGKFDRLLHHGTPPLEGDERVELARWALGTLVLLVMSSRQMG